MSKGIQNIDDFVERKKLDGYELPQHSDDQFQQYFKTHAFDLSRVPSPEDAILFYNGMEIGSRGNIVCINGKAKSRKTVIACAMMSSAFSDDGFLGFTTKLDGGGRKILHVDTEQGYSHYWRAMARVLKDGGQAAAPDWYTSVHTRDAGVDFRLAFIEWLIKKFAPDIVYLDGVTDLVFDINSQDEATKVGEKLLAWSFSFNCLIVAVIHLTKTTGYMTGAIGTYLEKKCQTAITVAKDEDKEDFSHVTCQFSRDAPFPAFTIEFDKEKGHYIRTDDNRVTSKGKGGDMMPGSYNEAVQLQVVDIAFRWLSVYDDERHFKGALYRALKEATGDAMNRTHTAAWVRYLNEKAVIAIDPDGRVLKADTWIRAVRDAPELDFEGMEIPPEAHDHDLAETFIAGIPGEDLPF